MTKILTRNFPKKRGSTVIDYPLRTFDSIESLAQMETSGGKLAMFLLSVLKDGLPDVLEGAASVSEMPNLICSAEPEPILEIIQLAQRSFARGNGHKQHEVFQNYVLENDEFTIATEVPVWDLEKNILGHIDWLRYLPENDLVELWDYKPNAHKETKAASQVMRYRNLLCKLAGIPLSNIIAGYFDDKNSYILTPPKCPTKTKS